MATRIKKKTSRPASSTAVSARAPSKWTKLVLTRAFLPLVLAAIAFAVYLPSLRSDFVSDARLEINEGFVTSLANLPDVLSLRATGMNLMLSDRPGEMIYLMLNAALWNKNPFGYHLDSILLHAANVALFFLLLRRLIDAERGALSLNLRARAHLAAAAVCLLFALHPVATESVAEVSFSSSLLVTFFTLLSLLAATAFHPDRLRPSLVAAVIGCLCAFAAVLTKESGLSAALLCFVYWFLFRRAECKGPWFLFLGATSLVSLAVLAIILRFAVAGQLKLAYLGGSFAQVFVIQPKLWIFMMGQLLWPLHLAADYTLEDMPLLSAAAAWAVLLFVLLAQAGLAWRSRIGALGVAIYWVGLVTVSNLVPLYCIVADRFYYLPLAGVSVQLLALLLLVLRWNLVFEWTLILCLLTLPALGYLSIVRQAVFANEFSLWNDTLHLSPHSGLAHNSLALAYFQKGMIDEAMDQYEAMLDVDPSNSCATVSIGIIDLQKGRVDNAIALFHQALAVNPQDEDAACSLGIALCQDGNMEGGMKQLRAALQIDPHNSTAHRNLGMALLQLGRVDEAIVELKMALAIDPRSSEAHYNLGNALARRDQTSEAVVEFEQAVKLNPNHFQALANLGVALEHLGRLDEAIARDEEAIKIKPDSPDLHDNLGVALAQKGHTSEAIAEFEEALRLNPDFMNARTNLARVKATGLPVKETR